MLIQTNLSLQPPLLRLLFVMDPTALKPSVPLFDPLSSSRLPTSATLSASIWAPQPQPSESTWTRAIDSINRVNDVDASYRPEMRRASSHPAGRFGEDVFGPVGALAPRRKDVGAIGDGRKKTSPDFESAVTICTVICAYTHL